VVTFWADRLTAAWESVAGQSGNWERLENLIWARDQLDGILRVVIIQPVNLAPDDRKIADAHVKEKLIMRLVTLDENTGNFTAEAVT
jgi:hypothetical protein